MDLRTFLFVNKISQKQFADLIGYNKITINYIVNGKRPGKGLARAIEAFTNGKVSFEREVSKKQDIYAEQQKNETTKTLD